MSTKIISAGAGSGKTYRLTNEMVDMLEKGQVRANGIIATTFTKKAAAELQERVRVKLLELGMTEAANNMANALIGTVHGLGVKLLRRFAFEAGVSPNVAIMAEEDQQIMFNNALATVIKQDRIILMESLSDRLGLNKKERNDWRKEVRRLTDIARSNNFGKEVLNTSKEKSIASLTKFLGQVSSKSGDELNQELLKKLEETIARLQDNSDSTKTTQNAIDTYRSILNRLRLKGQLHWYEWVKISKVKVGAKSREDVEELIETALSHDTHPEFHADIRSFIHNIFDLAVAAIDEYDEYKKKRGLIDYIDMEIAVNKLLDQTGIQAVLSEELDLLMVDEFQDTSPIQLEIFLKLSKISKYAVWVGDPKQSIYGFRGAEPELMQAIIDKKGGVKDEDILKNSWRSRKDIVYATNAIFTKSFDQLPEKQIVLDPVRSTDSESPGPKHEEHPQAGEALMHWHFEYDGEGRAPGKEWLLNCIAREVKKTIDKQTWIQPKGSKEWRPAQPGDVAILCRSNYECQQIAEALHHAGLKAAISRAGLLNTAESKLILACLKYLLQRSDSLSVAEIMLLASQIRIEDIIEDRLDFLEQLKEKKYTPHWGNQNQYIHQLDELRSQVEEFSSAEILNIVLEELDLRRIISQWGNQQQRLSNVDVLRSYALQYEENCNRLHTAASLGGFLLWLGELENNERDKQGSGEDTDAVNVLTYHSSKGLEWPIVVLSSLEQTLRNQVWDMTIVQESPEIDLDNILANRWIRYWINPYADQYRRTNLQERLEESEEKKQGYEKALQEEARLLYVGITRARDYLVFPTRSNPTKWLNRCFQQGKESEATLDNQSNRTPWAWNKQPLLTEHDIHAYPRDFTIAAPSEKEILFFDPVIEKKDYLDYHIDLKQEKLGKTGKEKYHTPVTYTKPVTIPEDGPTYQIAKALKSLLTADQLEYGNDLRLEIAEGIIARYELDEDITALTFSQQSSQFYQYLHDQFDPQKIHRKYPVMTHYNDRRFETVIDLIVETEKGLIIIQHSGFGGSRKQWKQKAKELKDWFYLSSQACAASFDSEGVRNQDIRTFVHFVLNGALLEIELENKKVVQGSLF